MKLEGKNAVITGGGTGIGEETALLFAREGANVLINGRTESSLRNVVEKAAAEGLQIEYIVADISGNTGCEQTVKAAIDKFGSIDILFNNAGVLYPGITHETDIEMFQRTMDINVKGTFMMSKYTIPCMIEKGMGCIVNNSSVVGSKGFVGLAAYATSKGAVTQLTRSMALEYADKGIRVNAVCPGTIHTPMVDRYYERSEDLKAAEERIVSFHPVGRIGMNSEIAHAVLFLCDDSVGFMTGSLLFVDGGFNAK